jgi:hypothetical protein
MVDTIKCNYDDGVGCAVCDGFIGGGDLCLQLALRFAVIDAVKLYSHRRLPGYSRSKIYYYSNSSKKTDKGKQSLQLEP